MHVWDVQQLGVRDMLVLEESPHHRLNIAARDKITLPGWIDNGDAALLPLLDSRVMWSPDIEGLLVKAMELVIGQHKGLLEKGDTVAPGKHHVHRSVRMLY